jgi:hypothetical protein
VIRAGLPACIMVLLVGKHIYQDDRKKKKVGMVVPYLIYVIHVELRHDADSLGFLRRRDENYAHLSELWA